MPLEALVSSDSHIVEPPDLWTSRMRGDFAERAPRVVSEETGDWWYIDRTRKTRGCRQLAAAGNKSASKRSSNSFSELIN